MTTKIGVVNICPECREVTVTDFFWDARRDPAPEEGPLFMVRSNPVTGEAWVDLPASSVLWDNAEFVRILQDLAPTTAVPCEAHL